MTLRDTDPLRAAVLASAERHIHRLRWGLADAETLADMCLASPEAPTAPEQTSAELDKLVRRTYAAVLYHACGPGADEAEQRQALAELYIYLLAHARRSDPAIAEELAQTALANIYLNHDRCREPSSFYGYAWIKLREAWRPLRPREREVELPPDLSLRDGADASADRDCLERLRAELSAMRLHHQQVLLYKLEGLSDDEIGALMGKSPGHVAKMRFDARKILRSRETLADCL